MWNALYYAFDFVPPSGVVVSYHLVVIEAGFLLSNFFWHHSLFSCLVVCVSTRPVFIQLALAVRIQSCNQRVFRRNEFRLNEINMTWRRESFNSIAYMALNSPQGKWFHGVRGVALGHIFGDSSGNSKKHNQLDLTTWKALKSLILLALTGEQSVVSVFRFYF